MIDVQARDLTELVAEEHEHGVEELKYLKDGIVSVNMYYLMKKKISYIIYLSMMNLQPIQTQKKTYYNDKYLFR